MEYTNLHSQQHHEDHLVAGSSIVIPSPLSSLAFPSLSVEDDHHEHAWRPGAPTFFLNNNKNNNNIHAINSGETSPNSFNNSMIQDLRFSLPTNNNSNNINIQPIISHHENQHLISNKLIKEESSTSSDQSDTSSFQTFSDMLISPSTNTPNNEMLLLNNTLSPTYKINPMLQPSSFQPNMPFQDNNNSINSNVVPSLLGGLSTGVTTFSQIFPSVDISKLSSSSMDSSNFRGGLDLFATTARFLEGGSLNQPSPSNHPLELFKGSSRFGFDDGHYLGQSNDLKLCNSSNKNLPSFNNNGVVLEPKRPSCIVEPKSTHQVSSKKQRFEARASCPPLKVRKEKLGDRIAALQQLVAPFGKTDTASVLMEAIGYIKFLQNQVETLSVPYMKQGLRNESSHNIQRISGESSEDAEEQKQGLRSRGLCLVPLTCITYITSDCGIQGAVWPQHHNFNPSF